MTASPVLDGLRVLVVEDEFLLAVTLADDLEAEGCVVVGPCNRLATAFEAAARERFDVALLDVNLGGTMVFPLADDLMARGISFMFLSGYGASQLPERFRSVERVSKPHERASLVAALRAISGR